MLSAWRYIQNCASILETEMEEYLEELRLTAQWNNQPAIVEPDCLARLYQLNLYMLLSSDQDIPLAEYSEGYSGPIIGNWHT